MECRSLKDTKLFAQELIENIKITRDKNKPTMLFLNGELGSGKTALTKLIAEILGVKEFVKSPTFILRADYKTKDEELKKIVHIDAYRLNEKESFILGIADLVNEKESIIIIEWASIIEKSIKKDMFNLYKVDLKTEQEIYNFNYKKI